MTRSPGRADELRATGVEAVICDVFDARALEAAVVEAKPEAVVHELTDLPKRPEPRKYKTQLASTKKIRSEGTRNLVAAARVAGARRFVAQSIAFAYEASGDWVKDESAPLALGSPPPMDEVIGAVAELERLVLEFGGLVLRYGLFYGSATVFANDGFYAELARKRRLPVIGSGSGMSSFVHVDDAAKATVAALERGSSGVYNVVDDDPAPAREWVPAYAQAIGAPSPMPLPRWVGRLAAASSATATSEPLATSVASGFISRSARNTYPPHERCSALASESRSSTGSFCRLSTRHAGPSSPRTVCHAATVSCASAGRITVRSG